MHKRIKYSIGRERERERERVRERIKYGPLLSQETFFVDDKARVAKRAMKPRVSRGRRESV